MEWQPIETAPKDGTEVLLFLGAPYNRIEKAMWFSPWANWQIGDIPDDPDGDEYYGIGTKCPTHWMPLPAPPSNARMPGLDAELWHMLRGRYGKDLQSVFLLVTTQDKDNVLRQDSWLVYPPGGAAVPNAELRGATDD